MTGRRPEFDADDEEYNLEQDGDVLILDPHQVPDHLPDTKWDK